MKVTTKTVLNFMGQELVLEDREIVPESEEHKELKRQVEKSNKRPSTENEQ